MNQLNFIRNFSIVAHIDHGKTTLTDRFLEITKSVEKRLMHQRFLDSHPISQERGVTIKLAPVRMQYQTKNKILNSNPPAGGYILNLIDTPGHIDFSYEVSRSLACCEGVILLVDAAQGIQAQTLAHFQLAKKLDLKIIPVINKIDLQNAQPEKVGVDLCINLNFKPDEIIYVSAKTGKNVTQVLETVVEKIPSPKGNPDQPLRGLVFDSFYHPYKGIVVYLKIVDGHLASGKLKFLATGKEFEPLEIGYLTPKMEKTDQLKTGEIGYIATGLKDINLCQVGDTITSSKLKTRAAGIVFGDARQNSKLKPLAGYQQPKPVVFFDFYPVENKDFPELEQAIKQLKLNDVAMTFSLAGSAALGKGFRMGFLGVFHALIIQERLERDFNLDIIITSPSVEYQIITKDNSLQLIQNASELPDFSLINQIKEPWIKASIFTPSEFLGNLFQLLQNHRGKLIDQKYYGSYTKLEYEMPLIELIEGFYDQLKSASSGFASLDYQLLGFKNFKAAKLEVIIAGEKVKALTSVTEKNKGIYKARKLAQKLKEVIPQQLFEVPIQVSLNGRIIARETLRALRKDVTAKLYGGDQTRKDKLLKKQKKGKKRMKQIGRVTLPQEAFMSILQIK